ncbi:MAG: Do family serine endopeptidase [Opitutaceae bacterium]
MKLLAFTSLSLAVLQSFVIASEHPNLEVQIDERAIGEAATGQVVSYADVLESATPSVVSVYTARIVRTRSRAQQQLDYLRQFGFRVPQQYQEAEPERERLESLGVGSGVIISEDGYIITNAHVIMAGRGQVADEILVRFSDDTEYTAELIGFDSKTDVAVLKIESETSLPALSFADSELLRVGDVVFAIGNPLNVGLTVTQGIISAKGRTSGGILGPGGYENFIQTDAAINMGNSGGALIDAAGRLIGINTAIVSRSGGSNGIGFAIPTKMALNVARNLIERGEVPRGLLGLLPDDLDRDMAEAFGLDSTKGALVNQVMPDSAAEKGGIRHGDVIVRIDDIEIESAPQLRLVVSQTLPGTEVIVELIRSGETLKLPVVLGSLDGKVVSLDPDQEILEGVTLEVLDEEARAALEVPSDVDGIVVKSVSVESPYGDAGELAEGMVILEVNGEAVFTLSDVQKNVRDGANRFYIWFQGNTGFLVIRM